MEIQRKALFNLLRMNWLMEPVQNALDWQVEDYRKLPLEQLFKRLEREEIRFDAPTFIAHTDPFENPEDFTDELLAGANTDAADEDRIYLLIFELWRRLIPEKTCLSIFCDELDHQIALYDAGELETVEHLEDAIANLQGMLDENADLGNDPKQVFQTVSEASANDLEDFLYDFTAAQIDDGNDVYASELLDGFYHYIEDVKWFDLLKVRLLSIHDPISARSLLKQQIPFWEEQNNLAFNLEVLAFLVVGGDRDVFAEIVKQTIPLLQQEEELTDLLTICSEFFQRIDRDREESQLNQWISQRKNFSPTDPINTKDPLFQQLIKLIATT